MPKCRAARAMLRWTALDLAAASRVGVATIRRVELVDGEIRVTAANGGQQIRRDLTWPELISSKKTRLAKASDFGSARRLNRK